MSFIWCIIYTCVSVWAEIFYLLVLRNQCNFYGHCCAYQLGPVYVAWQFPQVSIKCSWCHCGNISVLVTTIWWAVRSVDLVDGRRGVANRIGWKRVKLDIHYFALWTWFSGIHLKSCLSSQFCFSHCLQKGAVRIQFKIWYRKEIQLQRTILDQSQDPNV